MKTIYQIRREISDKLKVQYEAYPIINDAPLPDVLIHAHDEFELKVTISLEYINDISISLENLTVYFVPDPRYAELRDNESGWGIYYRELGSLYEGGRKEIKVRMLATGGIISDNVPAPVEDIGNIIINADPKITSLFHITKKIAEVKVDIDQSGC
ncbi:MAG: hypothetical protein JXA72_13660 [Bacteroidales bacterium]|nr:hypothetical protein [Bacteroidales bacterium]